MDAVEPHQLFSSIERALTCYRDPKIWRKIQHNGMRLDLSWVHSAKAYLDIYASLI